VAFSTVILGALVKLIHVIGEEAAEKAVYDNSSLLERSISCWGASRSPSRSVRMVDEFRTEKRPT